VRGNTIHPTVLADSSLTHFPSFNREQKEKADAKEKYWKASPLSRKCDRSPTSDDRRQLHVQGKTLEAKSDLSRLAKIRAERDAAQAKRKAEAEGNVLCPHSFRNIWTVTPLSLAKTAEIEAKRKAQQNAKRV
jgi:hypothetical protein